MTEATPAVYHFDDFRLDAAKGVLYGAGDVVLALRPKSFALLRFLVENPERLHVRAELLQTLWPDVVVTDDSLTQCASDLRHAFGDRASHVLRTVPRRGYMLTAKVRTESAGVTAKNAGTNTGRDVAKDAGSVAPAEPGPIQSSNSACLMLEPFAAATPGPLAVLAKTLTDDLRTELARFEGVRVFAATHGHSSVAYRVHGELRGAGDNLHLAARLDDMTNGAAVWAEKIEWPVKADIAAAEGIVEALAAALVRHADREDLRKARLKSDSDLTVRELCLIGRDHHQRGTEGDTHIALSMFDRAITLAPNLALPHAWQAYTVHRVITHGWGPPIDLQTARERALAHTRRAVQLEPESPLCLSRLAFILLLHQRWDEAIETARAALRIARPADYATRNTCCEVLAHGGNPGEAASAVQRALALDPHCPPTTRSLLGRALLLDGDPEAALPELRWCAARMPDYAPCFHSIIVAAIETGRMEEARGAFQEAIRLQPHWTPANHTGLWFFRDDADAERFKAAFFAAGWPNGPPDTPPSSSEGPVAKSGRAPRSSLVVSRQVKADLRSTKPLGNA